MTKKLNELALNITEQEYRDLDCMHYSAIAKYAKEGFSCLNNLNEKVESSSLTFGSIVDTLVTEGIESFNKKYIVVETLDVPDSIKSIITTLFDNYSLAFKKLEDLPKKAVIEESRKQSYRNNWKDTTLYDHILEKGKSYYDLLYLSKDKIIISSEQYADALKVLETLKTTKLTKLLFKDNNPFDETIQRYYQLKFKETLEIENPEGNNEKISVECKAMLDLIMVNYETKEILPMDLKTTSRKEWDFPKSFLVYKYDIQADLYTEILKKVISKDSFFKDFTVLPFQFVVINKDSLIPLVWKFDREYFTSKFTLHHYKEYLFKMIKESDRVVPLNIDIDKPNSITQYFIDNEE